jgi:hypothetical protein
MFVHLSVSGKALNGETFDRFNLHYDEQNTGVPKTSL